MPIVPRVKPKSSSSSNASFFSRLFFFFFSPQRTRIVWKSLGQNRRPLLLILATFFLHREFLASCGPHSKYGFFETNACHKNASAKEDWKTSKFGLDFLLNRPQRGGEKCFVSKEDEKTSGFCLCDGHKVAGLRNCGDQVEIDCQSACKEEIVGSRGASKKLPRWKEYGGGADVKECPLKKVFGERPGGYENAMKNTKRMHAMFKKVIVKTMPNGFSFTLPSDRRRASLKRDFVLAGERLAKAQVEEIRGKTEAYVKSVEEEISGMQTNIEEYFENQQGIVIVGGSKYSIKTSYWIAIHAVRRAKSRLPIELWFPANELPSCEDVEDLRDLGVIVRSFSELGDALNFASKGKRKPSRFAYKLLALTFSSFKEALSVDADNLVLRDPETKLFNSEEYKRTGAVLWRDFWRDSSAPDARLALFGDENAPSWPKFTHESGQMLVDKSKHWNALFLALYFNAFDHIFYPLFGGFMGIGDKEVFAVAMRYFKDDFTIVSHDPDHVGIRDGSNGNIFGNTMLHRDLNGDPLFLHANKGKMTNHVPDFADFSSTKYIRRWEESAFLGSRVVRVINEATGEHDFEKWIFDLVSKNKFKFGDVSDAYYDVLSEESGRGSLLDGMYLNDYLQNPGVMFLHSNLHS
jgi:alpha 1,2-mannosyltransferase